MCRLQERWLQQLLSPSLCVQWVMFRHRLNNVAPSVKVGVLVLHLERLWQILWWRERSFSFIQFAQVPSRLCVNLFCWFLGNSLSHTISRKLCVWQRKIWEMLWEWKMCCDQNPDWTRVAESKHIFLTSFSFAYSRQSRRQKDWNRDEGCFKASVIIFIF